jgi:hypothetical protein
MRSPDSKSNRPRGDRAGKIKYLSSIVLLLALVPKTSLPDSTLAGVADTRTSASRSSVEEKIQVLSDTTTRPGARYDPVVLTDSEANTYLEDHARDFLPPAVTNPELRIASDHVTGSAEVDFSQLNQGAPASNDWTSSIMASVFKGKQRVTADGKLETSNGQGKVTVRNVSIGSTAIPDWLVQILLQNYVQNRYKLDLSKPFTLPDHVTRIELASGRATFIRSADKKR